MEDVETVNLEIDVRESEKGIIRVSRELKDMEKMAEKIGDSISAALKPLSESLGQTTIGIEKMTDSLGLATVKVGELMDQMAREQSADQLLGGVSTTINGLSLLSNGKLKIGRLHGESRKPTEDSLKLLGAGGFKVSWVNRQKGVMENACKAKKEGI